MINLNHVLWACIGGIFIGIVYPIVELISGTKIANLILILMITIMIVIVVMANIAPEMLMNWIESWI